MGKPTNLILYQISFQYDGNTEPIVQDITFHLGVGWSGVVGANGSGKTTLLKLAGGYLFPTSGTVSGNEDVYYCNQLIEMRPPFWEDFRYTYDKHAIRLKNLLQIDDDWYDRWDTLSEGERKRLQLGIALWLNPTILAIDEPTNHLDDYAQELISNALATFKGIGLLVSHDRRLLDRLCTTILVMDPPSVLLYHGNYSQTMNQINQEQAHLQQKQTNLKKQVQRLTHEFQSRKHQAAQADKQRSKRHIAKKDHDTKAKIDLARITGKDGKAGRLMDQMRGRLDQVSNKLDSMHIKKQYELGIWWDVEPSKQDQLGIIDPTILSLGTSKQLVVPQLVITPTDRIGLIGSNGAGKSTLLRYILSTISLPHDLILSIPQEIPAKDIINLLHTFHNLDTERMGRVMNSIRRLNSDPVRVLESEHPSPGEIRKLMLALGIERKPHLITMDEPTNHMDLPSIICLEEALAEIPIAMILISHDRRFLESLQVQFWKIQTGEGINQVDIHT
jgi:macrolide transport system ATP-binding/permease protein